MLYTVVQTELFGSGPRVLLDDSTGSITYLPDTVDPARAASWFATLLHGVEWRSERRWMYDRQVDVPRLVAGYRFADVPVPQPLPDARDIVAAACGVEFNSVGLNLYRDGNDSVAAHNDHIDEIVAGFPIALVSLGATRLMTIRSKARPRRAYDVDLEPGQPARHELRDAVSIRPRNTKNGRPGGQPHQFGVSRSSGELTRAETERARGPADG